MTSETPRLPAETRLWRLAEIIAAARKIHSSLSLESVLNSFLKIATGEVGAEGGSIFLTRTHDGNPGLELAQSTREMSASERETCGGLARSSSESGEPAEVNGGERLGLIVTLPLRDESRGNIGVLQIYRRPSESLSGSDRLFLTQLSHFAALSIRNAQAHRDSVLKAELDREIAVAREIQVGTLPQEMPVVPGYDLAGFSQPAEQTSGDSFDLVPSEDGGLILLLADATGHGTGPALSVTQVRAMLRLATRLDTELATMARQINNQLCDDLGSNRFVTAFLGRLEPGAHRIRYHSAGQAPLLQHQISSGRVLRLGATSPPLGIVPLSAEMEDQTIELEPGDTLALITDGVFEAENESGEEFGEGRVAALLRKSSHDSCAETMTEILEQVAKHRGDAPQLDDVTILLVRRSP